MKRFAYYIMITTLFASQAAGAEEVMMQPLLGGSARQNTEQKIAAVIKPQWRACSQDSDCTWFAYNCKERLAVNKTHLPQARDAVCSIGAAVYCSWKQCMAYADPVVVCGEQHQCITKWVAGTRTVREVPAVRH